MPNGRWVLWVVVLVVGVGCGGRSLFRKTVVPPPPEPVPTAQEEVQPEPSTDPIPPPRRRAVPAEPRVAEETPPPPAPPQPAVPQCPQDDPVDGRTHYMAGLDALQVGDGERAWEELFLCLCKTPDNRIAQRLLHQVESPPEAFFGEEYTEYQVQPGDTLSKIARQAYGDPFLFYALARYNGIDNPSQLRTGQTLRVPSPLDGEAVKLVPPPAPGPRPAAEQPPQEDRTSPEVAADPPAGRYHGEVRVALQATDDVDPSPVVRYILGEGDADAAGSSYTGPIRIDRSTTLQFYAEDRSGNRSPLGSAHYELAPRERLGEVEVLRDQGDLVAALAALDEQLAEAPESEAARSLYRELSVAHAEALVRRNELLAARDVLQRAETKAGGSPEVARQLAELEKRIGIEQLLSNASLATQGGEYEGAYTALQQVLELEPTHAVARGKLVVVRSALVDQYSKEAMGAYRRQDLDESIRLWDRVLELDPVDETALLRRAEAEHLRQQFQKKFE